MILAIIALLVLQPVGLAWSQLRMARLDSQLLVLEGDSSSVSTKVASFEAKLGMSPSGSQTRHPALSCHRRDKPPPSLDSQTLIEVLQAFDARSESLDARPACGADSN